MTHESLVLMTLDNHNKIKNDNGTPDRSVVAVIKGQPTQDGAGVTLRRIIGTNQLPDLDPFLMLDEFGSDDPKAYIAGFPDHPHRGFETVTYMLDGRMRHQDNQGNSGILGPGGVQWMTAGRGIVHSEMPEQVSGLMRGFQLWINLPAKSKMSAPRYQNIEPNEIPVVQDSKGISVKVIAGTYNSTKGPATSLDTDPMYFDVHLESDRNFEYQLPKEYNAFLYVYQGSIEVLGDRRSTVDRGELAVLSQGVQLHVSATENAQFIFVAGRPLREPIVKYGPFVMNTEGEVKQALNDYRSGKF